MFGFGIIVKYDCELYVFDGMGFSVVDCDVVLIFVLDFS